MIKGNISYIILNYNNIDETINCINHLQKIISSNSSVIVVDNNTLNDSEEKLLRKYKIDLLKLDNNYGFAKANNKGILYAKKKFDSKFYVVINNDVIITQSNFEQEIINIYDKYNFDMLGPKIDSPTKESVNPFPVICNINNLDNEISRCIKLIKIYNSRILYFILKIYLKLKYTIRKKNIPVNGNSIIDKSPLHGCAIIFSDKYIKKYDNPFYNDTFLFHEEEFLYQRVINDKLISIYDPNLEVYHKEGSSIKKSTKNERISKLFREQERLKSLYLLRRYMEDYDERKN